MSLTPEPRVPGPDGWRAQSAGGHAVAPERAENERLIAESGISRSVPVWVWALIAAVVAALAVVFFS